jgi:hypothetical protein
VLGRAGLQPRERELDLIAERRLGLEGRRRPRYEGVAPLASPSSGTADPGIAATGAGWDDRRTAMTGQVVSCEVEYDFFSTVAAVIPVLFVVLAIDIQHRVTGHPRGDHPKVLEPYWLAWFTIAGLFLILGEVGALHVLASDATGQGWTYFVGACLAVGGLMTLLSLFHARLEILSRKHHVLILLGLFLLLTVAIFAMYAVDIWVADDLPDHSC